METKPDMRNLLHEIKRAKKTKENEIFDNMALQIKKICQDFYSETGCTVSEIIFPIEVSNSIGKSSEQIVMIPKIEVREFTLP